MQARFAHRNGAKEGSRYKLSRWTRIYPGIRIWQTANGAVSRYKLSRSHIPIAIGMSWYRELYCVQWCVSGFKAITNLYGQLIVRAQKIKKKRKVRAHTQHLVFARLAFTSPRKKHDKQLTLIVRVSIWWCVLITRYGTGLLAGAIIPRQYDKQKSQKRMEARDFWVSLRLQTGWLKRS